MSVNLAQEAAMSLGSRFRVVRSGVTPVPFNSGNVETRRLPKNLLHKSLICRLTGGLTVGVAGPAVIAAEAPLGLIQKIEVVGDGRKTLFGIPGREAYRLSNLFRTKAGELAPPATGVATNAFAATFILDHQAIGMRMPLDSYLDTRRFEDLDLRVSWGSVADIATPAGGGGTVAIAAGCTLDVYVLQSAVGFDAVQFNRSLSTRVDVLTADNPDFSFEVPKGGTLVGILFHTDRDAAPVSDILTTIGLKADTNFEIVTNVQATTLLRSNVLDYSLDAFLAAVANIGQPIPGYYYLDLSEDGMISAGLNTLALNTLEVHLGTVVGGGTTRRLYTTYIFYEPLAIG